MAWRKKSALWQLLAQPRGLKASIVSEPERLYFDWNATAPLRPQAKAVLRESLAAFGNPSSVHAEGRSARRQIERAREQVAALVGAQPGNVVFTSGGTEANILALTPAIEIAAPLLSPAPGGKERSGARDRLLLSAIEHSSVRTGGRFPPATVEEISVTPAGRLDLAALADRVESASRPLVSIMAANNETGIVQPVAEAAAIAHAAGGLVHVDAVQAPGRIACDIGALGADLLTLSAHKIGGPKGVGALVFAAETAHMRALRDALESGLKAISPQLVIFGETVERLPNTTLFALDGVKAETAVIAFDLAGIAVSSGAACSSGKVQPSHVLAAMGVAPRLARGAVRLSLGWSTEQAEIDRVIAAWRKLATALCRGHSIAA
jgi:cysteine desulfurase